MTASFSPPPDVRVLTAPVIRKYRWRIDRGWQLTMTSVKRDLILAGKDNDFIRDVILELFGQYRDNKQINRVRRIIRQKGVAQ